MIERRSKVDRDLARGSPPAWQAKAFENFTAIVRRHDFPCFFATEALKRDFLRFTFCDPTETDGLGAFRSALIEYLDVVHGHNSPEADLTVLVVFIKPELARRPWTVYRDQLEQVLQFLHEHDPNPWPLDIPQDPDDPLWSFCFAGVPLFVNASTPANLDRRSRNLGDSLTLVIQPREVFDRFTSEVRTSIRRRVSVFDRIPVSPHLGEYGDKDARECWQYILSDSNTDSGFVPDIIKRRTL